MCVSRVNGKSDRGNATKKQAVCNDGKNWFVKCPSFWQFGTNWKLLNVNIDIVHEIYAKIEIYVYVATDSTADAASCSKFAAFIWTPEDGKPNIWMHIQHCLGNAKAIPIQEVQEMLCVDAAASDAENLWMWCLASIVNDFRGILFTHL